jgi:hypothetical protein
MAKKKAATVPRHPQNDPRQHRSPNMPQKAKAMHSHHFWGALSIVFALLALAFRALNLRYANDHLHLLSPSSSSQPPELPPLHLSRPTMMNVTSTSTASRYHSNVTCSKQYRPFVRGCHMRASHCGRAVRDSFVSAEDVAALREIAEIGMKGRSMRGGPTIMDINSGT